MTKPNMQTKISTEYRHHHQLFIIHILIIIHRQTSLSRMLKSPQSADESSRNASAQNKAGKAMGKKQKEFKTSTIEWSSMRVRSEWHGTACSRYSDRLLKQALFQPPPLSPLFPRVLAVPMKKRKNHHNTISILMTIDCFFNINPIWVLCCLLINKNYISPWVSY